MLIDKGLMVLPLRLMKVDMQHTKKRLIYLWTNCLEQRKLDVAQRSRPWIPNGL